MSTSPIIDDLKDAIIDVTSGEYYHRAGGETRHWLEGIELVIGGIVTAFLVPYLKKLAEKSADATWTAIAKSTEKPQAATTDDSQLLENAGPLITSAAPEDHRAACEFAAESVRIEMQRHNFTEKAQSLVIHKLAVEIERISRCKDP